MMATMHGSAGESGGTEMAHANARRLQIIKQLCFSKDRFRRIFHGKIDVTYWGPALHCVSLELDYSAARL